MSYKLVRDTEIDRQRERLADGVISIIESGVLMEEPCDNIMIYADRKTAVGDSVYQCFFINRIGLCILLSVYIEHKITITVLLIAKISDIFIHHIGLLLAITEVTGLLNNDIAGRTLPATHSVQLQEI